MATKIHQSMLNSATGRNQEHAAAEADASGEQQLMQSRWE